MPYEIVKSRAGGRSGYRVKKEGTKKYFSKEALPLKQAKAQRSAIVISEMKKIDNYQDGGLVKNKKKFKSVPGNKKDFGDVVPAILEPGEIVIPVEKADKVKKLLKKNKIKIKGL